MERKINKLPWRRTWLMMSVFLVMALFSSNLIAQISINVQNKPIKEILKVIETKSEYRFFYNEGLKGLDKITSLKVSNVTIEETMNLLLANSEMSYQSEGNNLIALMAKANVSAQKIVTGVVTDEQGEPIIGATVLVKNTKIGTITNFDGRFSLEVDDNATLLVSYIGYNQKEVKLNGQRIISVKLTEDVKALSEVVVTALGIKREQKALGYAVQAVEGNILQTVKGVDMATSLTGKVAGFKV